MSTRNSGKSASKSSNPFPPQDEEERKHTRLPRTIRSDLKGTMLRMPEVLLKYPRGKTQVYSDIADGLFIEPIRLGPRCSAWPEGEVDAVIAARAAGASDNYVRQLVSRLHAARRARR